MLSFQEFVITESSRRSLARQLMLFSADFHKPAACLTSFRTLSRIDDPEERLRENRARNRRLIDAMRLLGLGYIGPLPSGGNEEQNVGGKQEVVPVTEESFIISPIHSAAEEGLDEKAFNDEFEAKLRYLLKGDADPHAPSGSSARDGTWGGQWAGIIKRTDQDQPHMIEDMTQDYKSKTALGAPSGSGYTGDFYTRMPKGPAGTLKPGRENFGDTLEKDVGTKNDRRTLMFPPPKTRREAFPKKSPNPESFGQSDKGDSAGFDLGGEEMAKEPRPW